MKHNDIYILAIETSCDDTSISILKNRKVLSNIISTQLIHKEYGGVVPEIASRTHEKNIIPVCKEAIKKANINLTQINAVAFTQYPGLIGSLLVGSSFAKSLALSLNIPLIAVNHIEAHILAHFIDDKNSKIPKFPFLCLTVSGGHTQIMKLNSHFDMKVLGKTIDDATGEAFDKIGKLLGLDYPAGAEIDKLSKKGNANKFQFTKPKTLNQLDFSFSGFKTNVLHFLQRNIKQNKIFIQENLNDICASVQKTIIDILIEKLLLASEKYNINNLAIAGGVSANSELKSRLKNLEKTNNKNIYTLKNQYTTDNGAMVGIVAYYKYLNKNFSNLNVVPKARIPIK